MRRNSTQVATMRRSIHWLFPSACPNSTAAAGRARGWVGGLVGGWVRSKAALCAFYLLKGKAAWWDHVGTEDDFGVDCRRYEKGEE